MLRLFASRYNAACCAAIVCRQDDLITEKSSHDRAAAIHWLELELGDWIARTESEEASAENIAVVMKHWQTDNDLANIRDPDLIALWPQDLQSKCIDFWSRVESLLSECETQSPAPHDVK